MSTIKRIGLVATSLGVAAAGVLTATTTTTAAGATTSAGSLATVNVYVTKAHNIAMNHQLRPGVHRFIIRSAAGAAFQLAQPAPGYTKVEAARDVRRGLDRGNATAERRFEANVTLLGGASSRPGDPAMLWANLRPGSYWALDTNGPSRAGKFVSVNVGGRQLTGGVRGTDRIRAINETDWARVPGTIAHRGRLTFRNDSVDNHFVVLVKLADGKTIKDFARWVRRTKNGNESPPPLNFAYELDTGVVSPGHKMTVKFALPRGRYVLTCFWPDADEHGLPHAFIGMYRGITLT